VDDVDAVDRVDIESCVQEVEAGLTPGTDDGFGPGRN
jgi:hypothetical protein